jgi:hypothetical protein
LAKIFFKIITSVPGASTYICTKSNGTVKHSFRVLYFAVYGDSAPDAGFSLTNFCYYSYFYLSTYEVSYNATYVMELQQNSFSPGCEISYLVMCARNKMTGVKYLHTCT